MAKETTFPYKANRGKEQNIIGKKIREARLALGIKQTEMINELEMRGISTTPSTYNRWEKGEYLPNCYQLLALLDVLHIYYPLETFSTGQSLTPDEQVKLADYRELLIMSRMYRETQASGEEQDLSDMATTEDDLPEEKEMKELRIYDVSPAAGFGNEFSSSTSYEMVSFPVSAIPQGTDYALRIDGDSMEPRYRNGDFVFIKTCDCLEPEEIGIFVYENRPYIKQFKLLPPTAEELEEYADGEEPPTGHTILHSLNRARANCDVHVTDLYSFKILGKVLNKKGYRM